MRDSYHAHATVRGRSKGSSISPNTSTITPEHSNAIPKYVPPHRQQLFLLFISMSIIHFSSLLLFFTCFQLLSSVTIFFSLITIILLFVCPFSYICMSPHLAGLYPFLLGSPARCTLRCCIYCYKMI